MKQWQGNVGEHVHLKRIVRGAVDAAPTSDRLQDLVVADSRPQELGLLVAVCPHPYRPAAAVAHPHAAQLADVAALGKVAEQCTSKRRQRRIGRQRPADDDQQPHVAIGVQPGNGVEVPGLDAWDALEGRLAALICDDQYPPGATRRACQAT